MRVVNTWPRKMLFFGLLCILHNTDINAFVVVPSSSFASIQRTTLPSLSSHWSLLKSSSSSSSEGEKNKESPVEEEDESSHVMRETSRLSHMMLNVLSVDRTVAYWTEKTGEVLRSTTNKDDGSLRSAFVALGNGKTTENCFALELVETKKKKSEEDNISFQLGNCLSYIGVSMLLQFQNNLLGALLGDEKPADQGDEPNGIIVKSAASAPGDYFCRICFKSKNLAQTNAFYTKILGMDDRAIDADMLCLRYDSPPPKNGEGGGGVPTTLVFERTDNELDQGTCFDHLVIATSLDIDEQYERIKKMINNENDGAEIFLPPTDMFGKRVMGMKDPNDYKIFLASE